MMTKKIVVLYSILFLLLTLPNLLTQNVIGDEPVYILEADRYLHSIHSFYNNSGSPPLLKLMSGIAYAWMPLNRDYQPFFEQIVTNVYKAADFLYVQNSQYASIVLILARLPHLFLGWLLGLGIFFFSKHLFKVKVAALALLFYTFHAGILAHSSTANLDLGTTAFIFFTLAAFLMYLSNEYVRNIPFLRTEKHAIIVIGVLLGLSQATKISAILLYPFVFITFLLFKKNKKWIQLISIYIISFAALWAVYGFQIGPILLNGEDPAGIESIYGSLPLISDYKKPITSLLFLPIYPLGPYLNNFTYQTTHNFYGHTSYLGGQFTDTGFWYFFPVVFYLKNSIILTILFCLSLVVIPLKTRLHNKKIVISFFWIFTIIAWVTSIHLQLGSRYFMPIYPFVFILSAITLSILISKLNGKVLQYSVTALTLGIYIVSNLSSYPTYFIYLNEFARFKDPTELISDSDYDWGQSVYRIGNFQKQNNWYPLYVSSSGGTNFNYAGIQSEANTFEAYTGKKEGFYAFSHSALVNYKRSAPEFYSYIKNQTPIYIIDNTIYVYKITYQP